MTGWPLRVAIIGGGIGGLTLAIALRQRGLAADVFEQVPALTEIGAAVALSANATRELERLGLLDAIKAVSTEPTELIYRDWQDGQRIAAHPVGLGAQYRERFGAPYFGIHRADLQRVLSGAVAGGNLHLGHRLQSIDERGGQLTLEFGNGRIEQPDLVVGADGVRSVVRHWITGGAGTRYSGTSAFRGIVPTGALTLLPDPHAIQFWMGPGAHLLHYAIGGGGEAVNFFAVVEGPEAWPVEDGWTREAGIEDAVAAFAGWHPAVTQMIAASTFKSRWGLFTVPPLQRWQRGRAVLLGDSAHAMLPHHGQGANTTIEDAITLAELLVGLRADGLPALGLDGMMERYQALRRARTRKIQHSSWATNRLLHLAAGPELAARDGKVARFPEDFAWIHGYDALRSSRAGAAVLATQ